jgi:hypothetical protein
MRVMLIVVAVSMMFAVGCKKKDQEAAVDVAAAATTPVSVAAAQAAGGAACPACPAAPTCPTCPECPVCADPAALTKGALGTEGELKVLPPAGVAFTVETAGEYQIDAKDAEGDPELRLYKGDELVASDSDSGDEYNALLFVFLTPGEYAARVIDAQWRPITAKVTIAPAPALESAGTLTPGNALDVTTAANDIARNATKEVTLTIADKGNYRIDATTSSDFDAEMQLIRDNAVVAENSDGGDEGTKNARIEQELEPGTYTIRVRDWQNREATINIAVAAVTP